MIKDQIERLARLQGDALLDYAARIDREAARLPVIRRQYQEAKQEVATLELAGIHPPAPKAAAAQTSIEILEKQWQNAVLDLQEEFQLELSSCDLGLEAMNTIIRQRRSDAVDEAMQSEDYLRAKDAYESARSELKLYRLRHAAREP